MAKKLFLPFDFKLYDTHEHHIIEGALVVILDKNKDHHFVLHAVQITIFIVIFIITEHVPYYEHYSYHGRKTEKTSAVSHEILKQQTRTKLPYQYMNDTWKVRLKESSKLEFYREVKADHAFEQYFS